MLMFIDVCYLWPSSPTFERLMFVVLVSWTLPMRNTFAPGTVSSASTQGVRIPSQIVIMCYTVVYRIDGNPGIGIIPQKLGDLCNSHQ